MSDSSRQYPLSRIVYDELIVLYFLVTIGGLFTTFTHKPFFILSDLTHFSYGMLAPYQGDSDQSHELAVVGWDSKGTSTLVPVDQYFPGDHGERNSRQFFETPYAFEKSFELPQTYVPFLTQILDHERAKGHPYERLDLWHDQWTRTPEGYDALRMHAIHTYVTQVQ